MSPRNKSIALLQKLFNRYNKNFLPSRYILLFDLFVIYAGFYFAYFIRVNLEFNRLKMDIIFDQVIVAVLVYAFFFWKFKSFFGIIRHTGLDDIYKVFQASGMAFLSLVVISQFARFFELGFLGGFSLSVLIIHFMLSFIVLIGARVFVKNVFNKMIRFYRKSRQNIIIYGAGASGMITCNVLSQDSNTHYDIVAFADDNPGKINKRLGGIPVYHPDQILCQEFVEDNQISGIIISIQKLNKSVRKAIIERSLELELEVKTVPPIRKWINGQLSAGQIKKVNIEDLLERDPIRMDCTQVIEHIAGKVVMITGAAGSIGSGLVKQVLTFQPSRLILLDQAESGLFDLEAEINDSVELQPYAFLMEPVIASIKDRYRLEQIFELYRPDIVYHAAAYKHVPLMENNPYEALLVNVFGTKALADLSIKYGVKKFVMISTDKAVNPTNVMGASKRIAEIYTQSIHNSQTQFITTRFGNVLGSNGSVVPLFKKQIESGGPITLTHKDITRYFMTIPEACSLVLEAGAMGHGGEILVFDMGEPVRIYDLAKKMIQLSGFEVEKDIQIKEVGLRPGEKLYEELLNDQENTLPTHHPKIMRARVRTYNHAEIEEHLLELASFILEGDKFQLVKKMKQIVPEFISMNSVYNVLDLKHSN